MVDTLYDLAQTTGGRILPASRIADARGVALGRIVSDSRQVETGTVFWALPGGHYEGDCFVHEAFRRGAQGAVASRIDEVPNDGWALQVDDTQRALVQWAQWKRRHFTGAVIGVTGSAGKTTARQMIHTVLQRRLKGTSSPRGYNNHWSMPLCLSAIEPQHDYAVLELAANKRGEIAALVEDIGAGRSAIAAVGDALLAAAACAWAAAEWECLRPKPSCWPHCLPTDRPCWPTTHGCGRRPRAARRRSLGSARRRNATSERLTFKPATGDCSSTSCAAAACRLPRAAAARAPCCSRSPSVAGATSRRRFARSRSPACWASTWTISPRRWQGTMPPVRGEIVEIRGATVIDDTCDSDPAAMPAALELLRDFDSAGRRIVICGDAVELGPTRSPCTGNWEKTSSRLAGQT